MPNQSLTCAQLAAGNGGVLSQTISYLTENQSGYVLLDIEFVHDGVSVRPNCDGPITKLRTKNTSNQTAWALLPNKRRGDKWVQLNPGTDVTIANQGTLNQIGVETFNDAAGVEFVYNQPVG